MTAFPTVRPRRLRNHTALRRLAQEHRLCVDQLVYPLFVRESEQMVAEVAALPGVRRLLLSELVLEAKHCVELGIPAVLLFGLPQQKDAVGSSAYAAEGIVQRAVREIKRECPTLFVMTDVCLCQYSSHGHCGVLDGHGQVDNDATLELLGQVAVSHAQAGADLVAPSDMMDGRIGQIRTQLDAAGFSQLPIMSYSAKFASAFYGPFREVAGSTPESGDRRGYQLDPANSLQALREARLDLAEGADILMVKPALAYLDVIASLRAVADVPIAAYSVSGEYAMLKAAASCGALDERAAVLEALLSIHRAGAQMIITYHAKEVAEWLN